MLAPLDMRSEVALTVVADTLGLRPLPFNFFSWLTPLALA